MSEPEAGQALPEPKERGDLDNPKKVKRAEIRQRLGRRQELEDIAWVLSSENGRRFFWRLLSTCHMFQSCYTGDNTTFFNEGMREVGLIFMADVMAADSQAYLKMQQESQKEKLQ